MRKAAILGLFLISTALVFGATLAVQPQTAQAGAYDDQCKASGGTSLKWDGVGLWWCCTKVQRFLKRPKVVTLWCKR